jgi:hypothetical protein
MTLVIGLGAPPCVQAQIVTGTLLTPQGGPMQGALVTLVDSVGVRRAGGFSDALGRFRIVAPQAGQFSIRAELVGRETVNSAPRRLAVGDSIFETITGGERSGRVAAVRIVETDRCVTRPQGGAATAALWEETAKALRATSFAEQSGMLRFRTETYSRLRSTLRNFRVNSADTQVVAALRPFSTRTPEELARDGYVEETQEEMVYYAPDHAALLSDEFVGQHCFSTRAAPKGSPELVGLAFEPVDGRVEPDVRGVFWIDRPTGEVRRLEFTYTGLDPAYSKEDGGGRLDFRRLPTGAWIVSSWTIKMPVVEKPPRDWRGRPRNPRVIGVNEAGGRVLETLPPIERPPSEVR